LRGRREGGVGKLPMEPGIVIGEETEEEILPNYEYLSKRGRTKKKIS